MGDRRGEGRTTNNLGAICEVQGDFVKARQYYQKGYATIAEIGDLWGESAGLSNLGLVSYRLGDFPAAWEFNERAIQLCRKIALWGGEAAGLSNLGRLAYQKGQLTPFYFRYPTCLLCSIDPGQQPEGIIFVR